MSLVNITVNNKNFQLSCTEGAESELFVLVDILNAKIDHIKNTSPNASFELILVMTSLFLQNELQNSNNKVLAYKTDKPGENKEKFSETSNIIYSYLKDLAQKLSSNK